MDSISGELYIAKAIDYESNQSFLLSFHVTDEVGNAASVDLTVNVNNLNDITPTCPRQLWVTTVEENQTSGL